MPILPIHLTGSAPDSYSSQLILFFVLLHSICCLHSKHVFPCFLIVLFLATCSLCTVLLLLVSYVVDIPFVKAGQKAKLSNSK